MAGQKEAEDEEVKVRQKYRETDRQRDIQRKTHSQMIDRQIERLWKENQMKFSRKHK